MNKYGIYNSEQFVSYKYYSSNHIAPISSSKPMEAILEPSFKPNYISSHKIYYSPEMSIPSFRDIKLSLISPRLFCGWVNSYKCYKSFVSSKCIYTTKLIYKTYSQAISNSWDKRYNLALVCPNFFNSVREKLIKFINIFFYHKKSLYIAYKGFFHSWRFYPDGVIDKLDDIISTKRKFLTSAIKGLRELIFKDLLLSLLHTFSRRKLQQELKHSLNKDVKVFLKFEEKNLDISMDAIFKIRDYSDKFLSFLSKYFKLGEIPLILRFWFRIKEILSYSRGVFLARFIRSNIELRELIDYRGVNNCDINIMYNEEGKKIKVVDRSRFHTYDRWSLGSRLIYSIKEAMEAINELSKRALEDTRPLGTFNAHSKRIFGYIYVSIKLVIHPKCTSNVLDFETGSASQPFLHIYTGFSVQPTYSGLVNRKQIYRRTWIAHVINMFSCFSNFNINLLNYW